LMMLILWQVRYRAVHDHHFPRWRLPRSSAGRMLG
jgi:hypothetical protein